MLYRGAVRYAYADTKRNCYSLDYYSNVIGDMRSFYFMAIEGDVQNPARRKSVCRKKHQLFQKMFRREFFDSNNLYSQNNFLVYYRVGGYRDNIRAFGIVLFDFERSVQTSRSLQRRKRLDGVKKCL